MDWALFWTVNGAGSVVDCPLYPWVLGLACILVLLRYRRPPAPASGGSRSGAVAARARHEDVHAGSRRELPSGRGHSRGPMQATGRGRPRRQSRLTCPRYPNHLAS
jgi:hypothetical protein